MKSTIRSVLAAGLILAFAGAAQAVPLSLNYFSDLQAAWPTDPADDFYGPPTGTWASAGGTGTWKALGLREADNLTVTDYTPRDGNYSFGGPAPGGWTENNIYTYNSGLMELFADNFKYDGQHFSLPNPDYYARTPTIRWTSNVTGTINLTGNGGSAEVASARAVIAKNGNYATPLWDSGIQLTGVRISYNFLVAVVPGDYIDFSGAGSTDDASYWAGFDSVAATGEVTFGAPAVPEPSTFVLAGLGLLGLGYITWRKKLRRA